MTNETETMAAQIQEQSRTEAHLYPNEESRDHRDHPDEHNASSSNINSSANSSTFKYRLFDAVVILSFIACTAYLVTSLKSSPSDRAKRAVPSLRHLNSIADEEDFLNSFVSTGDDDDEIDANHANHANDEYDPTEEYGEDTKTPSNDDKSAPFELGEIVQVRLTKKSEYYFPAHVLRATKDHSGNHRYDLTSAIHGFRTMNGVDSTRVYSMQIASSHTEAVCQFKMQVPCTIIEYHGEECISAGGCYEVLSRWDDEALIAAEIENNNSNGSNLRGAKVEIERRIPLDHVQFRVEDLKLNSSSDSNSVNQESVHETLQLENEAAAVMARREEATEEEPNMR